MKAEKKWKNMLTGIEFLKFLKKMFVLKKMFYLCRDYLLKCIKI